MGYENFYQPRMNNSYPYPQQNMIAAGIKGRPVSSIEEVRATQIDYDGSLFVFPDVSNKKIYTKQVGVDGIVMLNMYELKPIPDTNVDNFITREEFNNAVEAIKQVITNNTKDKVEFNF